MENHHILKQMLQKKESIDRNDSYILIFFILFSKILKKK